MKKILVYGSDAVYFDYTLVSLKSFLRFNAGWRAIVMDVGLTEKQVAAFAGLAEVIPFPREPVQKVLFIPSARARVMALTMYPAEDALMLYLDGDSLVFGSVEPLVASFLASGKMVAIAAESDKRFNIQCVECCWAGNKIPKGPFPEGNRWRKKPILNTGMVLAVGDKARTFGENALRLFDSHRHLFLMGEQTLLDSIIYEDRVDHLLLPVHQHCYIIDKFVNQTGPGYSYVHTVPTVDGKPVLFRHFCGVENKRVLSERLPQLKKKFAI